MNATSIILGVRIDNIARKDAVEKVADFLRGSVQRAIFTPNPEMLVDACRDRKFREVLNSGSLNICDGKGIQLAAKTKLERIPGVDFMLDICALAERERKSIFLLGSESDDAVKKTAEELRKKFPSLKIAGWNKGPMIEIGNWKLKTGNNDEIIKKVNEKKPDILFVAFGHGKQEAWIYENLQKLPSVKAAMGVGGAFDYISGKIRRAPCWMRQIGIEWMYRLILQPRRLKRIAKATLIFSWLIMKEKNSNF